MKKGTITLARSATVPNSHIDEGWLLAQIYELRDTLRFRGHSLAKATILAVGHYNDELRRLMPDAYHEGDKIIAIVRGVGELRSPHVEQVKNPIKI